MGDSTDDAFEDDGNSAPHRRGYRPAFAKKDKAKAETTTPAPAATAAATSGSSDSRPAATVGGSVITMEQLDHAAANQLAKLRQQEYDVARRKC